MGGSPAVLVFSGDDGAGARRLTAALRSEVGPDGRVLAVCTDEEQVDPDGFVDAQAGVHTAYGIATDAGPTVVVLDPNVRVAVVHHPVGPDGVEAVAATIRDLAPDRSSDLARRHAPVLLVPDALDAALCDRLVEVWEAADPIATGVETTADGRHIEALDHLRKRRRDHVVSDAELQRTLTSHIGRRVIPEVHKAFGFSATKFEGFKLGCYTEDDAGFFEAHRDNLSPATAHRRFALSINLNDDYEGGELRFPEYGRQRYRPDRGEALVFSGSHLHEVLPVSRGRRFVVLSFLF